MFRNFFVTINNYCADTKGEQDIPSILEHVKSIHKKDVSNDGLWEQEDLIKFIDNINKKNKHHHSENNNHNLGKLHFHSTKEDIDPSNTDAWPGLMPVKV